jgi:hypothetical protein
VKPQCARPVKPAFAGAAAVHQRLPYRDLLGPIGAASTGRIAVSDVSESNRVRNTQQVLAHHLQAFAQGLDALVSDYTEQSSIVLQSGTVTGLAGIRQFFEGFLNEVQPGFWEAFKIQRQTVCADVAYLVWEAKPFVNLATDTLVIRHGKIAVQTFTVA